jgi:hypothetical protein
MGNTVYNYVSLANARDLTTPTATQGSYLLGDVVKIYDVDNGVKVVKTFMYVKAGVAMTAFQPYVIAPGAASGAEWVTATAATSTTVINVACVPQVDFTINYYGFVQIEGKASAKLAAVTHTIGDTLELISAATTLTLNSATSGTVVFDASVVAICNSVSTGAETGSVMLVGRQSSIAAS